MGFSNSHASGTIAGNVSSDGAKIRTVGDDKKVCNFSVATNHGYGDRRSTTFWKVEVWGKDAEFCAKDITKGMPIVVSGDMYMRAYEHDGVEKKELSIEAYRGGVSYERKKDGEGGSSSGSGEKKSEKKTTPDDDWS